MTQLKLTMPVPGTASYHMDIEQTDTGKLRLDVAELVTKVEELQCRRSWRCRICEALMAWRHQHGNVRPAAIAFTDQALLRALTSFAKDHTTHAMMLLDMAVTGGPEAANGQMLLGMRIVVDNTLGDDTAFEIRS